MVKFNYFVAQSNHQCYKDVCGNSKRDVQKYLETNYRDNSKLLYFPIEKREINLKDAYQLIQLSQKKGYVWLTRGGCYMLGEDDE